MAPDPILLEKVEALRKLLDERDRLYTERDEARGKAVDAALASVKEQTKASFEASEKAIVKAEEAQQAYNLSHNDLARKMDEQNKATMPRTETETRFRATDDKLEARFHLANEKIGEIHSRLQLGSGKTAGAAALWGYIVGGVGLVLTLGALIALGASAWN